MKCSYCGKKNKPGAVVCKRCGIGLPPDPSVIAEAASADKLAGDLGSGDNASSVTKAGNKAGNKKAALIAAAIVLAVLALAVAIYVLTRPGNVILPAKNAYTAEGTCLVYGGEPIVPETTRIAITEAALNGSRAGMWCENDSLYDCFKGENAIIAKDVVSFTVTSDGRHIVYLDQAGMLWSADRSKTDAAPVNICSERVQLGFAVSPDGNTVIFNKVGDEKLYLYTKGSVKELCDKMAPVAVSNAAKCIWAYSTDENALYYVTKRGKAGFIRSNIGGVMYVNASHDEIVFSTEAGEGIIITMLSVKGKDPVELYNSDAAVKPVLPASGNVSRNNVSSPMTALEPPAWGYTVVTCPLRSFNGVVFDGGALVRYVKKAGAVTLESKPCTAIANDKYTAVIYNMDGALYSRNLKAEAPESLATGCAEFKISSDGKTVWFLDNDSSLKHLYKGTETLIAKCVEKFEILPNGKEAMFIMDGGIYLNKGGNVKKTFVFEGVSTHDIVSDAKGFYICLPSFDWQKLEEGGKKIDILGNE